MPSKVSVVLATLMVGLTFSAQQKDDQTNEDKPLSEGNGHLKLDDVRDVLMEVLSFCPPINWAWLRRVNSVFNECLRTTIDLHFKQHGVPLDPTVGFKAMVCSEEWKMEDVLKSVMDKPGFRGAIFNKDECTLINHSLRGSQVCSEKGFKGEVRINGLARVDESGGESKCKDHFLHLINSDVYARNIHTGQDMKIRKESFFGSPIMVSENQLLHLEPNQILIYKLDWGANKSDCVYRETNRNIHSCLSQTLTDESGICSSVFCATDKGYSVFDIPSKQWRLIRKQTYAESAQFSPDGKFLFIRDRQKDEISIQTIDGDTTLLRISSDTGNQLLVSPDSKFVGFEISSNYCIMNLRSGVIDVISDMYPNVVANWMSDTLFRMRRNDGRFVLRCAHNPCVDVVTLNQNDSLIGRVKLGDEVDSGDLFYHLERIGPNLFFSRRYRTVIQVEWLGHREK